jgi:CRP/FNR family transcriptional regulator, cyclic AMP receptor protein
MGKLPSDLRRRHLELDGTDETGFVVECDDVGESELGKRSLKTYFVMLTPVMFRCGSDEYKMSKPKIVEILRELRFSSGLSEQDMDKLADVSTISEFPAGTPLFLEGSAKRDLYLLRSGRVQLSMTVPTRGSLPILTVGDGDLLGWTPALMQGEMTATAVAITDTQAIQIGAIQLQALCDRDHDIGYEIMRRVAIALFKRLVATRLQILDLYADPSHGWSDSITEGLQ